MITPKMHYAGGLQSAGKTLSLGAALLLALTSASFALTQQENLISAKLAELYPGQTLSSASRQQVADATIQAIRDDTLRNSTPKFAKITTDKIAAAGIQYAPSLAGPIGAAGLSDLTTEQGNSLSQKKTNIAAKKISKAAVIGALNGTRRTKLSGSFAGTNDDAEGAAAVTASMVAAVKDSQNTFLLTTVVSTAVKSLKSKKYGSGVTGGMAGAASGATYAVAGVQNADVNDTTSTPGSPDADLATVLAAAGKAAGFGRISEVAQAAAFAFAGTYRSTGGTNDQATFTATNAQDFANLLVASFKRVPASIGTKVLAEVQAGISLAYSNANGAGEIGTSSQTGSRFLYVNGQPSPVTDVIGL